VYISVVAGMAWVATIGLYYYSASRRSGVVGTLAVVLTLVSVVITPYYQEVGITESYYYKVYYVEAPFGIIYTDTEGSFVFASGDISTQLGEAYVVKYFYSEELKSLTLDSSRTSIVIDKTFRLERRYSVYKFRCLLGEGQVYENYNPTYKIHLPFLPNITYPERYDWNIP